MKAKKYENIAQLLVLIAIILVVNVIGNYYFFQVDLTEEKRFTLAESTKTVTEQIEDPMVIRVLLEGEFPAGFQRLQQSVDILLDDLRDINPNIEYYFEDISDASNDDVKAMRDELAKQGIVPLPLKYFDGAEYVQKGIYPFAIVNYRGRQSVINLLEAQKPGEDEQIALNKSVERLEYKFANHFQKISLGTIKNIAFTAGHGELGPEKTFQLERELRKFYTTGRFYLDSVVTIDKALDLLIVAGPTEEFSDKDKFKIDQYVMNGGKVMWLIEKMDAHLDSINRYKFYVPRDIITNLDDLFFKHGIRIQPNLVMDLEATQIPQYAGEQGGKPQALMFKWPYHPLAQGNQLHPITKNLDRVNMFFPSTIDTVKTSGDVDKTVLLTSSKYSRYQLNPMRLNFEFLKYPLETNQFNKGKQPLAVLAEGRFPSLYKNRVSQSFQKTLDDIGVEFREESVPTKQIYISDSDIMKNIINTASQTAEPLGFNLWERRIYEGNKDFLLNAIEYMMDENGVLESRSKQVTLRLLDSVKTKNERKKWQFINIGLPLLFLGLFGILYNFFRRRKYSK